MEQFTQQVAQVLSHYFATVVHFSEQHNNLIVRFYAYGLLDRILLIEAFRASILAAPEASGIAMFVGDGSGACVLLGTRGLPQALFSLPADPVIMQYYELNTDIHSPPLKTLIAEKQYDFRQTALFSEMATQFFNTSKGFKQWRIMDGAGIITDGIFALSSPLLDINDIFVGVMLVAPNLRWISDFLKGIVESTQSIAFLVDSDGILRGASLGLDDPAPTPIQANSSDTRIVVGYHSCIVANQQEAYIGQTRYLCRTTVLKDEYGLNLRLAILTPRSFYFTQLDNSIATSNRNYSTLWRLAFGLCAVALVLGVAAMLVLSTLIARPLARLAACLDSIADFQLQQDWQLHGTILYAEMVQIEQQFSAMSSRLAQYKAFLPATFTTDVSELRLSTHESRRDSVLKSDTEAFISLRVGAATGAAEFSLAPPQPTEENSPRARRGSRSHSVRPLELGISPRVATCLVVDTDDFHARLVALAASTVPTTNVIVGSTDLSRAAQAPVQQHYMRALVRLHGLYVEHVLQCVQRHSGNLDNFQGDHVFASWNTFVPRVQHSVLACRAALDLRRELATVNEQFATTIEATETATRSVGPISLRVAVTNGRVAFGRVGCESLRGTTVMGQPVQTCQQLVKHAKKCAASVLVDSAVFAAAKDTAQFQPIDVILEPGTPLEPGDTKPMRLVYELVKEQRSVNDEWMYVYNEQEREREREPLMAAFAALLRKDFATALTSISQPDPHLPSSLDPLRVPAFSSPTAYAKHRIRGMAATNTLQPATLGCNCRPLSA
eukprot:TRINITY_DN80301_c0_g1_i1.p1 TRINITY_DN80301_c0_g1~~TRINITY_DN80301_c0_g1_i1.p1  ORF type:complete len:840 (+),score=91.96 TRINITY_DN80301_c0_g1_i1:180-2522(+)